jgi:hypothetical protein
MVPRMPQTGLIMVSIAWTPSPDRKPSREGSRRRPVQSQEPPSYEFLRQGAVITDQPTRTAARTSW